jgi:hypothetical protein
MYPCRRSGSAMQKNNNIWMRVLVISFAVFESENYEKLHISLIFLILEHSYGLSRCC